MENKDTEYRMKFAERLKTTRAKNNMTQEILAENLEVSVQLISKWENANSEPNLTQINQLADIFNVSIDYLTGRTENERAADAEMLVKIDEVHKTLTELKILSDNKHIDNTKEDNNSFDALYGILSDIDVKKLFKL